MDLVKDKVKCGEDFLKDCLKVPQATIDCCKVCLELFIFWFLSYLKWYFTMLHTTQVLSPAPVFVGVSREKQDPFWWINIRKNKDQNSSLLKTKIYFFIQKQGTSECLQKKDSTAADICLKKDFLRFQGCIKAG